jgi:hypothetical protein
MSSTIPVKEVGPTNTGGPSIGGGASSSSRPIDIPVTSSVVAVPDLPPPGKRLGPEQLYEDADDSYVSHVLSLLRRAKNALLQSVKFDPRSEFTDVEQQLMVATVFIGKAVKSREIGDGFTAVLNAVRWSLANRDSEPFTARQINAIVECLNRVLWAPYIHFDTAMSLLDSLEDVELNIESPYFAAVAHELDA